MLNLRTYGWLIIMVLCGSGFAVEKVPAGKAKAVIQVWLWGGPPHLDTFDPKPGAGEKYCGEFNKTVKTNVPGIELNAMMPMMAEIADKYSLIRSMTHGVNAHETASYMMQTGRRPGRNVFPSVGAVVSLFKGYGHGYNGLVPPYVVLTRGQGRFSEAGFLGLKYKPFITGGDPNRPVFAVNGIVAAGITPERQKSRRELLHKLDTLGRDLNGCAVFKQSDECEDKAYALMFGEVRDLFDLNKENKDMRERYGRNSFGQSCLMARRLVEYGVPYVTINYPGWDTHKEHFSTMKRKLPELDRGLSALLIDLDKRGLLDTTIVWVCGEFGASPKIDHTPPWNGGRHHYGKCFSVLIAGGGFKGGRVVGASNETGEEVAKRPVYPEDLIRSIYIMLGIDPDQPLPNNKGLEVKVLPEAQQGEGILRELMQPVKGKEVDE